MFLDDALTGYWLDKQRDLSPHTVRDYSLTFARLRAFLGAGARIEAITPDDLRRFLDDVQAEHDLGAKTLANTWIALSSLWTWAEKELHIPHCLRGRVDRPRYRRPPVLPYDRHEVLALVTATAYAAGWDSINGKRAVASRPTAQRDRAILLTLVDTGIRAQELCDLTVADYDPRRAQLHVRQGKGRKARYVYLGQAAHKAIWKYLATRPGAAGDQPLFATRTATHLDRNALRHMIERCAQRAGVPHAGVHRFRHTFAVNFLRNGGNVLELQALLGHEKLDTIHIYASLAQVDLQQAQKRASPADNWQL